MVKWLWLVFLLSSPTSSLSQLRAGKVQALRDLKSTLLKPITMSGFSSGGGMATQFQVAYSSLVSSIGVFASTYYRCGHGGQLAYSLTCIKNRTEVSQSLEDAYAYENEWKIDPLSNLNDSKIFVWSGTKDSIVPTAVTKRIGNFYENFTEKSNIRVVTQTAGHVFPTEDFGPKCPQPSVSFIGNCNFFGVYEMLTTILGPSIQKPSANLKTQPLIYFDQSEFTAPRTPNSIGLDNSGYYYLPSNCMGDLKCPLHVFFHGCTMGGQDYQPIFVELIGYLKMAEMNNIVMLFPRAAKVHLVNPFGCWDIFGAHGQDFATKDGVQVSAIRKMVGRLFGEL